MAPVGGSLAGATDGPGDPAERGSVVEVAGVEVVVTRVVVDVETAGPVGVVVVVTRFLCDAIPAAGELSSVAGRASIWCAGVILWTKRTAERRLTGVTGTDDAASVPVTLAT